MPSGEMDPVYSIGVNNRFIGIDNDMIDDPLELIRAAQAKPKKEKEVKPTKGKKDVKSTKLFKEKQTKVENPTENDSSDNKRSDRPRTERGRGRGRGRGSRGGGGERGRGRGGRGGGFNSGGFNSEDSGFDNNNQGRVYDNNNQTGYRGGFGKKDFSETQTEGSGFGGGFGGGFSGGDNDDDRKGGRSGFRRGRGGGRGRGRGGNREFDRRSGSDKSSVKAVDKRDGSGSYNWGTPQDELAASEEQPTGGFGAPKEEDTPAESTEVTETEETVTEDKPNDEPPQMTFDEWKKQQDENRAKPQFNLRKVDSEKKGMKQLKKPTEEENEADGSLFFPKKYYEEKLKTSGRVKEHMNLNFQYSSGDNRHFDTSRRGGRGRGGGRGGRSGKRDEFGNKNAEIALENTEEFPSLG